MSGAAQRDELEYLATGTEGVSLPATAVPVVTSQSALQQIAAERLAAHRNRRAQVQAEEEELKAIVAARTSRARNEIQRGASKVRDAVAARYEQSVSYREFLSQEAQRAVDQARAEAEIASRNALAVAEAQAQLIAEMDRWNRPDEPVPQEIEHPEPGLAIVDADSRPRISFAAEAASTAVAESGLKVRLYENLSPANAVKGSSTLRHNGVVQEHDPSELAELEQEIEFRLAPEFNDHLIETQPIPANIIEFPRQLVAPKKARPRREEGPLRDEAEALPQLRIFEVEAEQISIAPIVEATAAPDWQSLSLPSSVEQRPAFGFNAELQLTSVPETAPLQLRLMAAAVDACCIGAAFIAFVAVAFACMGRQVHAVTLPVLAETAGVALFTMFAIYRTLFFTLAEATPGMRFARIGLCTFADSNPTRKAMRRRMISSLIAACPLGLGLLWMALDDDRLGWHDRMSRMYPRAY